MMSSRIILAGWMVFALATGLAYLYLLGIIAFAVGFTGAGIFAIAKKKWVPGVVCIIQAIAAALMLLGYMIEMPWDQWLPEPWRTILSVIIFTVVSYFIVRLILKNDKKTSKPKATPTTGGKKG